LSELTLDRYKGRRQIGVIVVVAMLLLATAAPALGATVTEVPTVTGDASPGSVLTASRGDWTPTGATASYVWLRCNPFGAPCAVMPDSRDRTYKVRDADLGFTLRVRLKVTQAGEATATGRSAPTAIVVVKPYSIPTPGDTILIPDDDEPGVDVTSTGPGSGTFTSGGQTGPGAGPAPDTSLRFITPFPVVRISGRFTRSATQLTRVIVSARGGARIRVDCTGSGCPYRRKAMAVKLVRVRALQRSYLPGATIEIRVTQPRAIGKYTRIKTRRGKAPSRIDRCLPPESSRPVRCPKG
jgi:hypothetical protein